MASPYRTTLAEQETVIRWDRADDQVHVWSASPLTWRKMARLGFVPVRETSFPGGTPSGKFYRIPLSRFRWGLKQAKAGGRPFPRSPRSLQEHRQEASSGPSDGRVAGTPRLPAGISV